MTRSADLSYTTTLYYTTLQQRRDVCGSAAAKCVLIASRRAARMRRRAADEGMSTRERRRRRRRVLAIKRNVNVQRTTLKSTFSAAAAAALELNCSRYQNCAGELSPLRASVHCVPRFVTGGSKKTTPYTCVYEYRQLVCATRRMKSTLMYSVQS